MLKSIYVRMMHALAIPLRSIGLLDRLQAAPKDSLRFWIGSQFAIYDAAQLVRLDVPWWSGPAIVAVERWLEERNGEVTAFEYGCGASTAWLARRCRQVDSVEHDADFMRSIAPLLQRDNIDLRLAVPEPMPEPRVRSGRKGYAHCDFSAYVDTMGDARYDLIIVDGRARAACLERALGQLADGGLIVFDNSGRRRYADAIARVARPKKRYRGWAPALPYRTETLLIGALPEKEG